MDPHTPPSKQVIGNRYRILSNEATGRLAVTYGAFDLFTGSTVEITSISKRRTKAIGTPYPLPRLRSDSAFCLKVVHPDILHAYDQFDDEDYIYLVSEYSGVRPISEFSPASARPEPMAFVTAMQKVVYAVEYYHSSQCPGCGIRPRHVRLSPAGEVAIDNFVACRLSLLSDAEEGTARMLMNSRDDAALTDIRLAGDVIALLLREIPKPSGKTSREDAAVKEALPALAQISERMIRGDYPTIQQVSTAMHGVEDSIRAALSRSVHAFPPRSKRRVLAAGEVLFREGDPANGEAFIIERGVLQISKGGPNGRDIHLDVSKVGDIVGEMALIDQQPRMATARALEPSTLVALTSSEFRTTMDKMDPVSRRLITVLATRLRLQAKEVARLKAMIGVSK